MFKKIVITVVLALGVLSYAPGQSWNNPDKITAADSVRGGITPERSWWDVLHYDLTIHPDLSRQTLSGKNTIRFRTLSNPHPGAMQIDLQEPLSVDSVLLGGGQKLPFTKKANAYYVHVPPGRPQPIDSVTVYFSGTPHKAKHAPWDGGWVWKQDSLGNPWVTVACQGIGASIWYPNKDHQYDEPDAGASMTILVPDTLVGVSNGRLLSKQPAGKGLMAYRWRVTYPINNYNLVPYIGKYVRFGETYPGEDGPLTIDYWVLACNLEKARNYLPQQVRATLQSLEKWLGPYPFYRDGYKIVDAPRWGMEHQSAVAYGNGYRLGNHGSDYSGSGWGMKFDFLVVHETAHEWFGNSISTADIADKWVHEAFAAYSEALYLLDYFGERAASEYTLGMRRMVVNDRPVIGPYRVNKEGSNDMFGKGRNLVHMLRMMLNDDARFRNLLRKMNQDFKYQIVTSETIEKFWTRETSIDLTGFFNQYLRSASLPVFEYKMAGNKLMFRFTGCVPGLRMPLRVYLNARELWLNVGTQWAEMALPRPVAGKAEVQVDPNFYVENQRL